MPRLFLTPLVIAGLLFLPSCSNAENDKLAECEKLKQGIAIQRTELNMLMQSALGLDISQLNVLQVIVTKTNALRKSMFPVIVSNEPCFTAPEVAEAKEWLSNNP